MSSTCTSVPYVQGGTDSETSVGPLPGGGSGWGLWGQITWVQILPWPLPGYGCNLSIAQFLDLSNALKSINLQSTDIC